VLERPAKCLLSKAASPEKTLVIWEPSLLFDCVYRFVGQIDPRRTFPHRNPARSYKGFNLVDKCPELSKEGLREYGLRVCERSIEFDRQGVAVALIERSILHPFGNSGFRLAYDFG
jgi:hypothetical protein